MRTTHADNPLHRIERWTGGYFRSALLWEVGACILVPHHNLLKHCASMDFQLNHLNSVQDTKDRREQSELNVNIFPEPRPSSIPIRNHAQAAEDLMDDQYTAAEPPENNDDEDLAEEEDVPPDEPEPMCNWEDVCRTAPRASTAALPDENALYSTTPPAAHMSDAVLSPIGQLPGKTSGAIQSAPANAVVMEAQCIPKPMRPVETSPPIAPRADAMNNPFVRVVHTNGIHNISLVYCGCRGTLASHQDLLYSRILPTTFSKYTTLFTTEVLDDFRLSNLECKTSAYQYFQKLRRKTSAIAPDGVPNKYQELRRLSREWRWLKQLKWAGYGSTQADITRPTPGELTLFCPACPQPHINLPSDWEKDKNK